GSLAQIDDHAEQFFRQNAIADSDSWMEIWNLVFMQFERKEPDGPLIPLPKPSIDTGAGLERVAAAVQNVPTNYDTDLFRPILEAIRGATRKANVPSMRVIADHARATAFLIADGVLPSNEGRGYVLRRIMRRAIRHAGLLDGIYALPVACQAVIAAMKDAFPELESSQTHILEVANEETKAFQRTLQRGNELLADWLEKSKKISDEQAFQLYDTFGFPLDLTQVIAAERGATVDVDGFEKLMDQQRARSTFAGSGEAAVADTHKALAAELGENQFLGYEQIAAEATLKAILAGGKRVQE